MLGLTALRNDAGARYASALNELTAAMIELAALDIIAARQDPNANTFHPVPDQIPCRRA
ncbi:MAG: hypothetical protein WBP38_15720 [Hyphomicrobium sp.]